MTVPGAYGVTASDFAARAAANRDEPTSNKTTLGKDDFLSILVAQLKNQDPLSPMEGTEFATQLAQFSNVEQLVNMNEKMEAQSAAALQTQITSQATLGSSLIGREVTYVNDAITVVEGQETALHFALGGAAATVKVEVLDKDGKVVFTDNLTKLAKGDQKLSIDTGDLDPGEYTYKLTAKAANLDTVATTTYRTGTVSGVSFENGQIMLHIGDHVSPLLEISEILSIPAPAPASSTNSSSESPST